MKELSQSLEDYLKTIYTISRKKKIVRVKDLAKALDVKTASVIGALKKLSQRELVEHEHYGYVALTPEGEQVAGCLQAKHQTLYRFLTEVLGVDRDTACRDACSMEHHISDATFGGIIKLIESTDSWPRELRDNLKPRAV